MQSQNSKNHLNNTKAVSFNLALLASSKYPGEDFHEGYKKYPQVFTKLVKSDERLNKELRKYFGGLKTRISVNWQNYHQNKVGFDLTDYIDADWEGEQLILKVLITNSLKDAIAGGGQMTELEKSIDIGWTQNTPPAIDFLNKYSLKLAGDLTDTTQDRIKSSLLNSLSSGLSQEDASSHLDDVIDDDARSAMIAHTESVRAFTEGRLAVADQIGADRKRWSATGGACPICEPLDGQVVGIDETFDDGSDAPPDPHPNCRCLIEILMPDE